MRRPIVPFVPPGDGVSRRLRDSIRELLAWFDAGTRTQELPQLDVDSADLIELVKPDGKRYATPIGSIDAGGGEDGADGADGAPGKDGYTGPLMGAYGTDPWDFEASKATNPDLAANGWIVQFQNSPYTVLTRAGDVDYSQPWAPAGQYNSTLVGGVLVLQLPTFGGAIQIYKATTAGTHTFSTHVWGSDFNNGNSNYTFISDHPNYNDGTSTFFFGGVENTNYVDVRVAPGPTVNVYRNASLNKYESDQVRYMHDNTGVGSGIVYMNANGMSVDPNWNSLTNVPAAAYMGIWVTHRISHFVYLQFIRRKPLNAWP